MWVPGQDEGESRTLRFEQVLDAEAALRARDLLQQAASAGSSMILDFARVRTIDWFALATLAPAVAAQPRGRVLLRGLCDHHARLLKYLGLDVDALMGTVGVDRESFGAEPVVRGQSG